MNIYVLYTEPLRSCVCTSPADLRSASAALEHLKGTKRSISADNSYSELDDPNADFSPVDDGKRQI